MIMIIMYNVCNIYRPIATVVTVAPCCNSVKCSTSFVTQVLYILHTLYMIIDVMYNMKKIKFVLIFENACYYLVSFIVGFLKI